jgi:hypothetical protein
MALCPGRNVISETLDGKVVMIDLGTGAYYSLGGSGAEIWGLIERRCDLEAAVSWLADSYPDDRDKVALHVTAFVEELRAEGLVGEAEAGSPTVAVPPVAASTSSEARFEAPVLEKYTDMAHVIMTDPIHEADADRGWPHLKE